MPSDRNNTFDGFSPLLNPYFFVFSSLATFFLVYLYPLVPFGSSEADFEPLCSAQSTLPPGAQWAQGSLHPFSTIGCRYRHWDADSARDCMRNRRIFVVGNSVARDFAFQTLSALCGRPRDRNAEFACKLGNGGQCFEECSNFSLTYVFANRLGDPPPGYLYYFPDPCVLSPSECMVHALQQSRPGDVFVFLLGLTLAWEFKHMTREDLDVLPPDGLGLGEPNPAELEVFSDIVARMGSQWRHVVEGAWRGLPKDVFRLKLPPFSLGNSSFDHNFDRSFLASTGKLLGAVNEVLDAEFSSEPWGAVDQWAINSAMEQDAGGNRPHYRDFIHYDDEPHDAAFNIILSAVCPE